MSKKVCPSGSNIQNQFHTEERNGFLLQDSLLALTVIILAVLILLSLSTALKKASELQVLAEISREDFYEES